MTLLFSESNRYYQTIKPTLIAIFLETQSHFQAQTPLFTKRIVPGVGLAEEPNFPSDDFGLNCCQIIAEALVVAWKQKRSPKIEPIKSKLN
jgi:hypothetical protein